MNVAPKMSWSRPDRRPGPPIRQRRTSNARLAALSVIVALALAEALFRVIGFPFDERRTGSGNPLARFDPELGWDYIPGLTKTVDFPDPEGGVARRSITVSLDPDLGARVASPHVRIDPSAPTIVFVGDSFTMGHAVTWDESFVGRVAAAFPAVQVVNLAVQGYGTDQAWLRLRRNAPRFSDLRAVVYGFIPRHVYRNAHADRRVLVRTAYFAGTAPRFVLADDGTLVLAEHPVRATERHAYSRIVAALELAWARYGSPPSLDLTSALVAQLRREAEARGARFLLLEWNAAGELASWRPDGGSLFDASGVTTIRADAGAPPDFGTWVIPGDGHPTPRAHAHVASVLVDALHDLVPAAGTRAGAAQDATASAPPARRAPAMPYGGAAPTAIAGMRGANAE